MSRSYIKRFDFKLHEKADADIIDFLEKDARTNVGIFREAMRLLMAHERGQLPIDEAAIVEIIKKTVNEEMIRSLLKNYDLTEKEKAKRKPRALGIQGKSY